MLDAATAVSLLVMAAIYVAGLRPLWRKTIRPWQALAFAIGWGFAALALFSPLDRWSDVYFSAHMGQHEILMLISAPLMVLGRPNLAALHVVPSLARFQRVWELVTGPVTVLVLHAVVLWVWHIPFLFEAALHSQGVHAFQHLGFFITAALFWLALIHGRYGRLGYGVGVLYVFFTAMHTQLLGALMTFAPRIWYPTHAARTAAAGGSPVADQQLAGVLMWVPFGIVFLCIALALLAAWLGEAERRAALLMLVLLVVGACRPQDDRTARQLTGGDPRRGRELIEDYGCGTCHTVPGVRGAQGLIGPPLNDIADRTFLAGQLPNTPDNMKRWIREPQQIEAGTAMPDMDVSENDARHMAAYLYTLRVGRSLIRPSRREAHLLPAGGGKDPGGAPVLHPQDRDFLERASQGSNAEIATGRLAAARAVRPDVRALGQRMVNDHTAINRELAAIAARHHIVLGTSLGDAQASYDRLVDLHRDHFDREFVQVMVEDHDVAALLFQGEASGGVDPELRAFAARTLPLIKAHLQHAKALRAPAPSVAPHTGKTTP